MTILIVTGMTDSDHYIPTTTCHLTQLKYLLCHIQNWCKNALVDEAPDNACMPICTMYETAFELSFGRDLSSLMAGADGQAPHYWLCPPDDCGLPVYTVYSVYSPEHPNLASVNDPPPLTHLNRERSEKAREKDTLPSKYNVHVKKSKLLYGSI